MVRAVVLAYWTFIVLGVVLLITQILLPVVRGRPLFPWLRTHHREVEAQLTQAREANDLADSQQTLKDELARLKSRRKRS